MSKTKNKTIYTEQDVTEFIHEFVDNEQKKQDSFQLIELFQQWSGYEPKMWGPSIIAFGNYQYQYASGHSGEAPILAFSPRKAALTLYIYADTERSKELIDRLGKFKRTKGCIYVKKLVDIDQDVLRELCLESIAFINERYPQMNIRRIEPHDNRAVASLIRQVFEEHDAPRSGTVFGDPSLDTLYELFQAPNSVFWIAELNQEIVGCCGVYPTKGLPNHCTELVKFYLSANARGMGIGKALMEKSIQSARELGFNQIYLESIPEFSNAVRIYEKQGFARLKSPLGDSGHETCTIWMLKELENSLMN